LVFFSFIFCIESIEKVEDLLQNELQINSEFLFTEQIYNSPISEGSMVAYSKGKNPIISDPSKILNISLLNLTLGLNYKHKNLVEIWNGEISRIYTEQAYFLDALTQKKTNEAFGELMQKLHSNEKRINEIQTLFSQVARNYIRQILRTQPTKIKHNYLFGLKYQFYYTDNILIYEEDPKILKQMQFSLNSIRMRLSVMKDTEIRVPICQYIEYCGIGYLAIGVENLAPNELSHCYFPKGGKIEMKDIKINELINNLANYPTQYAEYYLPTTIHMPESIVLYKKSSGYVLLVNEPGILIRPELFLSKTQEKEKICSEGKEIIYAAEEYYSGTGKNKNYLCCKSCFDELSEQNMLKFPAQSLQKHSGSNETIEISDYSINIKTVEEVLSRLKISAMNELIKQVNNMKIHIHSVSEISELLHSRGIPTKFIGKIFNMVKISQFRHVILAEMAGKCAVEILNSRINKPKAEEIKKNSRSEIIKKFVTEIMENTKMQEQIFIQIGKTFSAKIQEDEKQNLVKSNILLFSLFMHLNIQSAIKYSEKPYENPANLAIIPQKIKNHKTLHKLNSLIKQLKEYNPEIIESVKKISFEQCGENNTQRANILFELACTARNINPQPKKEDLINLFADCVKEFIGVFFT